MFRDAAVQTLDIKKVVIARRSRWQNPYAERVIGTLRRELLDHVIVFSEAHLRRLLRRFVDEYYHRCRTHLSLGKDSPEPRAVATPAMGKVVELPLVGGLHLAIPTGVRKRARAGRRKPSNRDPEAPWSPISIPHRSE